ncbi:MAG: DNA-binding response regulator [Micavibrio sp.]|nr:DNA-binding response regulator [Micavibrio sp.]HCK32642.1 DNA-binding response regulator [Rhodospirillaceae bacterium]
MPYYAEKTHILVVDDDDRIRDLLKRYLQRQDFVVSTAQSAMEAEDVLKNFSYDLMVLDVMMPGKDGISYTEEIRKQSDLPVILLTAKGEVEDRLAGLSSGADDYLVKPFEPQELLLRIQAVLKRAQKYKVKSSQKVKIGPWIYDRDNKALSHEADGQSVALTDSEGALCNILVEHANNPVSRYDIADKMGLSGNERSIDVQITRLRKKIEDDSRTPTLLKTIRGKGYLLKVSDVV